MLEHKPPRRDPRVLAIAPTARGCAYAAVDAWEVRGLGEIAHGDRDTLRLALARLLIQTRPSVIVIARRRGPLDTLASARRLLAELNPGIPIVVLSASRAAEATARAPRRAELIEQYPEIAALGLRRADAALRLACGTLVSLTFPRRRYATDSSPTRSAVVPEPPRSARASRVPGDSPARRARRRLRGRDHAGR